MTTVADNWDRSNSTDLGANWAEGWALRTLDEGFVAPAQAEEVPPEE